MYCCIGKYLHPIFDPPLALYHAEVSVHFLSFKAALAINFYQEKLCLKFKKHFDLS